MDRIHLMADLTLEEGMRSLVYDDATGQEIKVGYALKGNPTIGIGWNIAGRPCTPELAQMILGYWVDVTWSEMRQEIPWVVGMPEPIQRALTNMAFNMRGARQLKTFGTFMALLQQGRYADAAADLPSTLWWRQVGNRGPKIQALILQGAQTGEV